MKPNLFNTYPRIMANPKKRHIIHNAIERDKYIKDYMGYNPIYMSVYSFRKIMPTLHETHLTAKVDKMFLDIDDEDVYKTMMSIHKYLINMHIIHRIHLSGNGFHVFFWITKNLLFPKLAISNFWDYLKGNKSGTYENPFKRGTKYISPSFNLCPSTRGDLGRIFRYPNTYNWKGKCYAIVIDDYLLDRFKSLEEFQEYAKKPYRPRGKIYFGTNTLDISDFDCDPDKYETMNIKTLKLTAISYGDIKIDKDVNFNLEDTPYCIQNMVKTNMHFVCRNEVIKFLFNRTDVDITQTYTPAQVLGILDHLKQYNTHLEDLLRNSIDRVHRNVQVIYENDEIPSYCYKIQRLGFCNREQCHWKTVIKK